AELGDERGHARRVVVGMDEAGGGRAADDELAVETGGGGAPELLAQAPGGEIRAGGLRFRAPRARGSARAGGQGGRPGRSGAGVEVERPGGAAAAAAQRQRGGGADVERLDVDGEDALRLVGEGAGVLGEAGDDGDDALGARVGGRADEGPGGGEDAVAGAAL